jgi:hypothetical protein
VTVEEWIAAYERAWREKDADAAAALFTPDSSYRERPLDEAHRGQEGVHAYWSSVMPPQDRIDTRFGTPIVSVDGRRAAVEFWVRMLFHGEPKTLTGILFLRFAADGRCEDLRETWHFEDGDFPPHPGWGT